jgi:hypothetical protein
MAMTTEMAESLPPAMPMEDILPAVAKEDHASSKVDSPQPEGPKPTETIYIQNLNEKIRVDSMLHCSK